MVRNSKGITLVALVVTIIVLLILAGVSLNLIMGNEGILNRATKAVDLNEIGTAKEQAELLVADYVVEYYEKKYVEATESCENAREYVYKKMPAEGEKAGEYWIKVEKETNGIKVYKNSEDEKEIVKGTIEESGKVNWRNRNNRRNRRRRK